MFHHVISNLLGLFYSCGLKLTDVQVQVPITTLTILFVTREHSFVMICEVATTGIFWFGNDQQNIFWGEMSFSIPNRKFRQANKIEKSNKFFFLSFLLLFLFFFFRIYFLWRKPMYQMHMVELNIWVLKNWPSCQFRYIIASVSYLQRRIRITKVWLWCNIL